MTIPITMRARNLYYCIVRHFPLRLLWRDLDLSTVPRGTFFGHPYGITLNTTTRWGRGCQVRQNVTIGNGAEIGGGAVVLRNVPGYMSAVGNPARIVGRKRARKFLEVLRWVPVRASADVPLRCVAEENPARAIRRVS